MYRERGFTNSNPYYRGRTHRATYELTSSIPEGHLGSRTDDDLDLAPGYRRWTYTYGEIGEWDYCIVRASTGRLRYRHVEI